MPPLPPRMIAASGSTVTVQWVCTETEVQRYELAFRPKNRQVRSCLLMPSPHSSKLTTHDSPSLHQDWRTISNNITESMYELRNLPEGRSFFLRVRCCTGGQWSSWSVSSRVIKSLKLPPKQPAPPQVYDVTTDRMRVVWAPPDDSASVSVYVWGVRWCIHVHALTLGVLLQVHAPHGAPHLRRAWQCTG